MPRRSGSPPTVSGSPERFRVSDGWLCLAMVVVVLAVYWPALSAGFVWDDDGHVTRADLRSAAGLGRIWFEIGATQQYYPLLHSAFWLEHHLWGGTPLGYHLVNVLLHATAACLFAALLRGLAVPGAWFAAFLFAVHPVCVESVAWISEQKNTLSAVLYLAAALAFLKWHGRPARTSVPVVARASRPCQGTVQSTGETPVPPLTSPPPAGKRGQSAPNRWGPGTPPLWYFVALFLFLCALLTKTVTATLPAALLVILWWRDGRLDWRRAVLPLLSWLALGAVAGLFTAHFERELIGARGADFALGALERGLLAGRVVWFYAAKLLWPSDLAFIYPRWTVDATTWWQWLFPFAALTLLFALWRLARTAPHLSTLNPQLPVSAPDLRRLGGRGRRAPLAVALLFGGTLFPVLGFFDIYPFRHSYVADHFQYLASLPLFALAGAGLYPLLHRGRPADARPVRTARGRDDSPPRPRALALPAAWRLVPAALLVLLGSLAWRQTRIYHDAFTLYRATLARNPASWLAHNNLAIALTESGRIAEAIPHLQAALRIKPDFPQAENNLGDALVRLDRVAEAIPHFERALQLEPRYAVAHRSLGIALAMSDRTAEAVAHFAAAVQIQPTYAEAELYWAVALAQTGRAPESIPHFERTLQLVPDSVDAHLGLAQALRQLGRVDEAEQHLRAARRLGTP